MLKENQIGLLDQTQWAENLLGPNKGRDFSGNDGISYLSGFLQVDDFGLLVPTSTGFSLYRL